MYVKNWILDIHAFLANQLGRDWLVVKLDLPEHLFMFTHGKVTGVSLLKCTACDTIFLMQIPILCLCTLEHHMWQELLSHGFLPL